MARRCALTNKKPLSGNHVSHANNKTKRWQKPNVHSKRVFVPEMNRFVRIRLSTRALRSVSKIGLMQYLRKNNLQLKDVT